MPNLTISVTDAQAVRIRAALVAHYAGTVLASAPLANQATDYVMSGFRSLVKGFEKAEIQKAVQEPPDL